MIYKLKLLPESGMPRELRASVSLIGSDEARVRVVNSGDLHTMRSKVQKRYASSLVKKDEETEIYLIRGGIIFLYNPSDFPENQRGSVEFAYKSERTLKELVRTLSPEISSVV